MTDYKTIKKLADLMKSENLKTLEICEKDSRIFLVKQDTGDKIISVVPRKAESVTQKSNVTASQKGGENAVHIKSPLVGVFYSSPSPDSAPYAFEGKNIKKGEILCIIEAMKQMNEIIAETDGKIAQVCVKNGDIVEFDQILFRIM